MAQVPNGARSLSALSQAVYIAEMLTDLRRLAKAAHFPLLGYLIGMAEAEALAAQDLLRGAAPLAETDVSE